MAASGPALLALQAPSRERVESLLRARHLDRTLTTAFPMLPGADALAAFGLSTLDARLGGGLPRGHVSELIGPISSGHTSLAWAWLGAATLRGESVAIIDTFDRFDPASAVTCGIELSRLLWVRGQAITKTVGAVDPAWLPGSRAVDGPGTLLERTIDRALKSLNLVLQSGVCTAVVFDFADAPLSAVHRVPLTTWLRLQRVVEGTDIACLLIGPVPLARSAGGITITTGATGAMGAVRCTGAQVRCTGTTGAQVGCTGATGAARWNGEHDRSRRFGGLAVNARLSSPRRAVHGAVDVQTMTRAVAVME